MTADCLPRHHPLKPTWWTFTNYPVGEVVTYAFGMDCDRMERLCDCGVDARSCVLPRDEISRRFAFTLSKLHSELDDFLSQMAEMAPRDLPI